MLDCTGTVMVAWGMGIVLAGFVFGGGRRETKDEGSESNGQTDRHKRRERARTETETRSRVF